MKAMVYTAPLTLEMLDVAEPEVGSDEVVVAVRVAGICGSELEGIRSRSPFRTPPLIMGHEFAGVRTDTGQCVIVNPLVSCRACDACRAGQENLCATRALLGVHRPGGFAERVAVPGSNLHAMPDDMTWHQAAIVEPLANAVHAWRLVAERVPARVGIVGAGAIGLALLRVARWRGALQVDVADLAPDRRAVAAANGAEHVAEELGGEYDVVFDAVGAPATRRSALSCLRAGGASVWLGLHSDAPGFDALDLTRRELLVTGSFGYSDADFRQAIHLAADTVTSWVVSFGLEEAVHIFTELMDGRTDVMKAVLVPQFPTDASGPS